MNPQMISYSFQEAIEVIDNGRQKCISHQDYWLNLFFPGKIPLLGTEWTEFIDIDGIKDYDFSLWQKVRDEVELLKDPYGMCKPPTRLFYTAMLFGIFYWWILGNWAGKLYLWPFGSIKYGRGLVSYVSFEASVFLVVFPAIVLGVLILLIRKKVKVCDQILAKKSYELENLVQELIDNALEFFKKENIDPREYPLRLRFNDYKGLKYVKEERNLEDHEYIAYLVL